MIRHIFLIATFLVSATELLPARSTLHSGSSQPQEKAVRHPKPFAVWQTPQRPEIVKPADSCDVIFLETGEEFQAKVIAIREKEIEYSYCNDGTQQSFTIEKSKVKKVVMASGLTIETAGSDAPPTEAASTYEPIGQESEGFSTAAFVMAIVSYFFSPFAFIGIILGIVGLSRHRAEPRRYRNRWMAVYGIVSGVVLTFFMVLIFLVILGLIL